MDILSETDLAALSVAEMGTDRVDRHRSGCRSGRDSSTGRSSRLKYRSNSPFLQPKDIETQPKYTYIFHPKQNFL